MRKVNKIIAGVLAAVMILGVASPAFAAGAASPTKAPVKKTTYLDANSRDHVNKTVTSSVKSDDKVVVVSTKAGTKGKLNAGVVFGKARNAQGKKVNITDIGNGTKGVFASKQGQKIKRARITSAAKRVTVNKNAFKGSKIKILRIASKAVTIKKNAFNKTKQKTVTIKFIGKKKKASGYKFVKGAFKGLSKKSKVIVSKKTMTNKEFKKLKKALKKAGFPNMKNVVRK